MRTKNFLITVIVAVIFFMNTTCAAKSGVIDVESSVQEIGCHQNVTFAQYFTWPESRLQMDIYLPATQEKSPAVIFVPGGWWLTAPKVAGIQICYQLAQAGFVAASIEYRHIGTANYIESIGDVKAAIRYLRAHADNFNIDKDKIAVMGMSAGGYLASMVGVTSGIAKFDFGDNLDESSAVQAVVDIFGPTDLNHIADDFSAETQKMYYSSASPISLFVNGVPCYRGNRGGNLREMPVTALEANPIHYVGTNTPPFLIMHGNADKIVSPSQSKLLYDELSGRGLDADYYILNGGEHNAAHFYQPTTFKIIVDFLNRVLR